MVHRPPGMQFAFQRDEHDIARLRVRLDGCGLKPDQSGRAVYGKKLWANIMSKRAATTAR